MKKNKMLTYIVVKSLIVVGLFLTGCGSQKQSDAALGENSTETSRGLLEVFHPVPATEPLLGIPELREKADPGSEVVFEAKVMGTLEPFVENRALFVVGDEKVLTSCDLRPGDSCPTPWDVCCDDPKDIRRGTLTVQVVDEQGAVLKQHIKGVHGLTELSRVRISGTVAPQSTPEAFIVNATGIELL